MSAWLQKVLKGDLGWKTITSALVLVVLVTLNATGHLPSDQFDKYTKLAEALGLVGLRDALSKLPK